MGFFARLSIKQKFRTLMIAISFAGLLVAVIAFFITDIWQMKENTLKDVRALAEVINKDVSVAIAFDDALSAAETLSALENQPLVLSACIYTQQNVVFAGYRNPNLPPMPCTNQPQKPSWRWTDRSMNIHHPIIMDRERLGNLVITYSLAPIATRLGQYTLISLVILVLSTSCVFVFSFIIERIFLGPIMNLTRTAEDISLHGDHTLRAQKESPDEIGVLVDSFNRMLDVIQRHEKEQAQYQQSLEQKVADRTTELQLRNQEVEEANRRLKEAIRHAETMAEAAQSANAYKSQFVANMSHEIRTPLNAILGFSHLLGQGEIRSEQERYYLGTITTAGKTLLSLINDILDLSKIEAGKLDLDLAWVDIRNLIRDMEQMFSQQMQKQGLRFVLEVDPRLPQGLLLDEQRLRQVLINLLGNAIKFTEKGHIGLGVRALRTVDSHKTDIELRVWDSGIGIARHQQAAVFEAFHQPSGQDSRYGGTGLGLTISKRLVDLMKGDISLKSTVGQGATFTVVLSNVELAQTTTPRQAAEEDAAGVIAFNPATILIADDNRSNRTLLKEYLKSYPFELLESGDGRATLEIARNNPIDLLLLDIKMPLMDGYQAAILFKDDPALADIPIIAVTASVPSMQAETMKQAGFDGYLLKPVNQDQLLTELKRFLSFQHTGMPKKVDDVALGIPSQDDFRMQIQTRLLGASPELLAHLSEIFQGPLSKVRTTMLSTDLTELAETMGTVGLKYKAKWLSRWSEQLKHSVRHFDIPGILSTLDRLAETEVQMKSAYGEKDEKR